MSLGPSTRLLSNERSRLKMLMKSAFPKLVGDKTSLAAKENEYWRRICINPDSHQRRIIDIDEWGKVELELQEKASKNQRKLDSWWGNIQKKPHNKISPLSTKSTKSNTHPSKPSLKRITTPPKGAPPPKKIKITSPAQYTQQVLIQDYNERISTLVESQMQPFIDQRKIAMEIKNIQKLKDAATSKLKDLKNRAAASQRLRSKQRVMALKYAAEHPEDKSIIIKKTPGRPNIERYYPHFSAVLMDIVNEFCAAGTMYLFL